MTREKIRDQISLSAISEKWPQVEIKEKHENKATWDVFNQLLDITPRGNFGNIGSDIQISKEANSHILLFLVVKK